jgi:hypothetical protein
MNVLQCPECKGFETHPMITTHVVHNFTEIKLPSYCADCGYSWWIVYQPDRTEERK